MSTHEEATETAASTAQSAGIRAGWFFRLMHTPLGQLLRGRITGPIPARPDPTADLPLPLANIVRDVVARTRLWKSEQRGVSRELAAHFRDGLDAGATAEHLARDFGDLAQAAKLIRRSMRRKRPWWWRTQHAIFLLVALVPLTLIPIYALLALAFFLRSPRITRNYANELNAVALAAPESQRAWPKYLDALAVLPACETLANWPTINPGWREWADALKFNQASQDALANVRAAAALPSLGYPISDATDERLAAIWVARGRTTEPALTTPSENPPLITILLPYLGEMRGLARHLAFDARRAAIDEDGQRVIDDVRAMLGMARQVADPRFLIAQLVALAVDELALLTAGEVLAEHADAFTEQQLADLAHALAGIDDASLRVDFSLERTGLLDVLQRTYSDDGNGGGRLTAAGLRVFRDFASGPGGAPPNNTDARFSQLAGPFVNVVFADRREILAKYDDVLNAVHRNAALPLWQRADAADSAAFARIESSEFLKLRYFPIALLLPALDRATLHALAVAQRRDAIQTAIALEIFRRRRGAYPNSLDEVVPALLPAAPPDRYDGKPLRYILRDSRPVLYSIGNNYADDGGIAPGHDRQDVGINHWISRERSNAIRANLNEVESHNQVPDADWVLYPPPAPVEPPPTDAPR